MIKQFSVCWIIVLVWAAQPDRTYADVYTLQDAVNAALATNEQVLISEENAAQADAKVEQAKSYIFPNITANGAYTRYNDVLPKSGNFVFQPLDEIRAALVLTQPLYTGGRTMAAWRAAQKVRESTKRSYAAERQNITMAVAEAYYNVIKAQKLVDAAKHSLERMERHRKITEREAETRRTKANMSALLRATTLVNQSKIAVVRAEEGLKIARQRLMLLTRLPEDFTFVEPTMLTAPQDNLEYLQRTALLNRNEYAASQLNIKVAEEFVAITKGGHFPQIYAEGGVRYLSSDPNTQLDATTYYGGIRIQIPIFEGGLMNSEVAEARSRKRQAELSSILLRRQIETEVYEAYAGYQTISTVLETARLQYEDARKNFEIVEALFSEGLAASLSLIDAEQTISFAERELVSATWDQQLAILRLRRNIGLLDIESI